MKPLVVAIFLFLLIYIILRLAVSMQTSLNPHPLHLITFGQGKYVEGVDILTQKASALNIFTSILASKDVTEFCNDDVVEFCERNPRGYGYWLWKPRFIQKQMQEIADNEFILYADAGCRLGVFNNISHVIGKMVSNNKLFCVHPYIQRNPDVNREHAWTKADLVNYLKVENTLMDTPQLQAGRILIRVTPESRAIIDRWVNIMSIKNAHLFNDEKSKEPNHPLFVEHRHDQSILSLLIKQENANLQQALYGLYLVRNFRTLHPNIRKCVEKAFDVML
jgi:hypothetical protein